MGDTDIPSVLIGIDVGGTFTDFVIFDPADGSLETFKLFSNRQDPAEAIKIGMIRVDEQIQAKYAGKSGVFQIIHGSTVATNALLTRQGSQTALITTCGFRDVLQIGRQNRPNLYDLKVSLPEPLVPSKLRLEVNERIDHEGNILLGLNVNEVTSLIETIQGYEVESIAICLLFAFLNPLHEQEIASQFRHAGYFTSASHEILPEFREYERTSTTVVNAYVSPVLERYLSALDKTLGQILHSYSLRIMQSNGGMIGLLDASRAGVRCILSGPAGGVVGAQFISQIKDITEINSSVNAMRNGRIITFDMGGTSTDIALIDGDPKITTETVIGGHPIGIPMLDIHTIGAGGGSIAHIDTGGAMRVGPQSAGAYPGPACYARGDSAHDLPTVTDANLVLGRLPADYFLGGEFLLDADRAWKALEKLGHPLGLDPLQAAEGVIQVVNAHMRRALIAISVEKGYDPKDFILVSFGGSGGLHASALARSVGIRQIVIPPQASTLSALGMLAADVIKDYSQTVMFTNLIPNYALSGAFLPLRHKATMELHQQGIDDDLQEFQESLDMRYLGQSYELNVPFSEKYQEEFHESHKTMYGYCHPERPVEIVNLRLKAIGRTHKPVLAAQPFGGKDPSSALLAEREVYLQSGWIAAPFFLGERLHPGNQLSGPCVVVRKDTTLLILPGDSAVVDKYGNIIIQVAGHNDQPNPVRDI